MSHPPIIQFDEKNKQYVLELRKGKYPGISFVGHWDICGNPFCGCANVDFHCTEFVSDASGMEQYPRELGDESDEPEDSLVATFSLDAHRRAFAGAANAHGRKIGKQVARELTPDDWRRVWAILRAAKEEQIGEVDVDSADLRDVRFPERADEGSMVGYAEIFPFGPGFEFKMEGKIVIADDMYCVQPNCDCRQTILTFLSPDQRNRFPPSVRYSYGSSRPFEVVEKSGAGQPPIGEFVRSLEEAHPELKRELARRNRQLSRLYSRTQRGREAGRRPEFEPGPKTVKVGRNDPCPCGSGKKFKKCCG